MKVIPNTLASGVSKRNLIKKANQNNNNYKKFFDKI